MGTVTVQIGNSDDKLAQRAWASFMEHVEAAVQESADKVHFSGHSIAEWQNAAWVCDIKGRNVVFLRAELSRLCGMFGQDAIAMTIGKTDFVEPGEGIRTEEGHTV